MSSGGGQGVVVTQCVADQDEGFEVCLMSKNWRPS